MIDDMFQEGTDKALDDRISRPLQAPPARPSFGISLWNTTTAAPKGVGAGALESAGFGADMLGAFGAVQAGYGLQADPSMLFDSKARKQRIEAGQPARDAVQSGEAFSTEIGTSLRATARDFAPDPNTSNAAEDLLFGLSRFMTKAVGYSVAAGGVPGAVFTGVDEGMTEADRLKAQGVDFDTRTKVGAVAGVTAGASVALPIAGKTVLGTTALVAAGGPGGFIAQQAASKAILENAGYDKIADQYNPFDPVGLAVSTLVPGAFGAYAMRGVRARAANPPAADPAAARQLVQMGGSERLNLRFDDARLDAYTVAAAQREGIPPEALLAIKNVGERSGPTAVSPKGAKGVMQFMDDTWTAYGKGDPRDPVASIDAGARFMKDLISQYNGNVRAAIAHYNGGGKAGKAVMEGRAAPAKETRGYLERTDKYIAERQGTEAGRAAAQDPEAVAAARVALVRQTVESWNLRDPADVVGAQEHLNAVLRASDQIGAGERVSVGDLVRVDDLSNARLLDDLIVRLEAQRADILPEVGNIADSGQIKAIRDEISRLEQSAPSMTDDAMRARAKEIQAEQGISYKAALSAAKKDLGARMDDVSGQIERLSQQLETNRTAAEAAQQVKQLDANIARVRGEREAIDAPTPKPMALAVKQAVAEIPATKAGKTETDSGIPAPKVPDLAPDQAQGAPAAKPEANPMAASLDAQAAEIARLSPDMMVQLEGMDAPMRLADALEAVRAEAANDVRDAPLLEVAANCFLRSA